MNKLTKSRIVLVIIALMFAIPLIAAFVIRSSGWQPTNTKNSGTLVVPPRDVTIAAAVGDDGTPFTWKDAQFHWTLVLFPSADCATNCIERIDEAVRMRLTLGHNAERLRIVYIGPSQSNEFFASRAPLSFVRDESNDFADEHARNNDSLALALIDPNGLLMMRYPDGYSAQGLRSDITRIIY
jgi:hypothetical protein